MTVNTQLVHGGSRIEYTVKETAQLIREALKVAFPGIKFSVRTAYGSCYGATNIHWTDGPTQEEVEYVVDRFSSKSFNGSDDSTHYHEQMVNGQRVQYSGWVNTSRTISPTLLQKAIDRFQALRASYGLPAVHVTIKTLAGGYASLEGADLNLDAGVQLFGYRYHCQYVSDAIHSIAASIRPNGVRVTMKAKAVQA